MPRNRPHAPTELIDLRLHELGVVESFFGRDDRVLEVGAGSGYQAALLTERGCKVSAIDVAPSPDGERSFYPVELFDGVNVPFANGIFGRIFSSHVLEHAKDLTFLLHQLQRVLREDGLVISILPTPSWRFWTSIAHYFYLLKYGVCLGNVSTFARQRASASEIRRRKGTWHLFKRILFAGPHGEFSNALVELWAFGAWRWKDVFALAGLEVVKSFPTGLFYTGYRLLPNISIEGRKNIAKVLGSSSRVYICRKRNV